MDSECSESDVTFLAVVIKASDYITTCQLPQVKVLIRLIIASWVIKMASVVLTQVLHF